MHSAWRTAEIATLVALCIETNTPRSLGVYLRLKYGCEAELASLSVDPRWYSCPAAFAKDYAVSCFLKKWRGLRTSIDKRGVALDGWFAAEEQCRLTNIRFRNRSPAKPDVERFLFSAQQKISRVLGRLDVSSVLSECRWSGGATFATKRGDSIDQKMSQRLTVTAGAYGFLHSIVSTDPLWSEALLGVRPDGPWSALPSTILIVPGNRFLTVPKDATKDRCIGAEPSGNAFMQQSVGRYMRARLRSIAGIDLNVGWRRNNRMAELAYKHGYATLDLSSASDTISDLLVWDLLPVDWYLFLDALRSKRTRINGDWVALSKFSSMGNAFTFELESLIFWALAQAVSDEVSPWADVLTFGDDLIVAESAYEPLVRLLAYCGFTTNSSKSYSSGYFFESCGKHYFKGVDVTPVYQKEIITDLGKDLHEVIRMHNRLYRWQTRVRYLFEVDAATSVKRYLRKKGARYVQLLNYRIPDVCHGDDGFLAPVRTFDNFDPNHGFYCRVWVPKSSTRSVKDERPFYAYKMRKHSLFSNVDPQGYVAVQKKVSSYRCTNRYVQPWGD